MAERGAEGWIADLGREEGVSRLIRAIALSDRFHVYLLLCETPRAAQALFDLLPARVAEEREEPVRLVQLDPYEGSHGAGEPIPFEHLADRVLERLVSPAPSERDANVIVVVDGSRALPHDDDSWALLFQRMNERRNLIAATLQGALVLCLPRRLEPVFAHAAPDFWSIRSLAIVVEGAPPPGAGMMLVRDSSPTTRYGEVGPEEPTEAAEIEAGIAAARESLTKTPQDAVSSVVLQIWLQRRVEHDLKRGALDRALHAAEEIIALARRRLSREPDQAELLHDLAESLDALGYVQHVRGDLAVAHAAYDESLSTMRRLQAREPDRVEWLRNLSVSLDHVGTVQVAREDLPAAEESYAESIAILRRLLSREPDHAEWLHDLSVSLDHVGDMHFNRRNLVAAHEANAESIHLRRGLLARDPARASLRHELALSLVCQALVVEAMGRFGEAYPLWREGLAELEKLTRRESPLPVWLEHAAAVREELARRASKPTRSSKKRRSTTRPPRGAA